MHAHFCIKAKLSCYFINSICLKQSLACYCEKDDDVMLMFNLKLKIMCLYGEMN